MTFYIRQALFLSGRWKSYSSLCRRHSVRRLRHQLEQKNDLVSQHKPWRRAHRQDTLRRRIGEIHIDVQLALWIYGREVHAVNKNLAEN